MCNLCLSLNSLASNEDVDMGLPDVSMISSWQLVKTMIIYANYCYSSANVIACVLCVYDVVAGVVTTMFSLGPVCGNLLAAATLNLPENIAADGDGKLLQCSA